MKSMTTFTILALLALALPASAQTYDWAMVGSTGTIDPAAVGWAFTGPSFHQAPSRASSIGLVARYPVTNTFGSGSSFTPGWTTLRAAYTDNSNLGSVTVWLFKVDKCNNTETLLCTITSSDGSGPQCGSCSISSTDIDFQNFTYYVEGRVSRSSTAATEELHSVALQ